MESRQLFTTRPKPAARERVRQGRALPVVIASVLLPGSGHFFLGKRELAVALLLCVIVAPVGAIALRLFVDAPWANLSWLLGRLAVFAAVFAIWDAPQRQREVKARMRERGLGPRLAAFLNVTGYGLAQLRMGEKGAGTLAILAGGGAHVALVLFANGPLRLAAESIPLALAVWGYRTALDLGAARVISTEFGELSAARTERSAPGPELPPTPPWWHSTTAAVALVWALLAGFGWVSQGLWLSGRSIDTREVVELEPYYRNPAYGISLEMQAPGWSFRAAPADVFVRAQHAAERTQVQLGVRPRLPWWDDPAAAVAVELEQLRQEGFTLVAVEEDESTLAGRPATRLQVKALRDGAVHALELRLLPLGHRRYVLRAHWDPEHAAFARAELRGFLSHARIEDRGEDPRSGAGSPPDPAR